LTLNDAALRRYARHIVLPEIGGVGQARLLESKVLVVGMGGLGAPLALYLAAAGVGRLGLVDDDRVDVTNLHRQVIFGETDVGRLKVEAARDRLSGLAAAIDIEPLARRLDESNAAALIEPYDLVADGTDNVLTRRVVHDAAMRARRPLVSGSVQGVDGQLTLYRAFAGAPHPCLHCLFGGIDDAESLPSCAQAGVLGPAAGLMGSLMAIEVIKTLVGLGPSLSGTLLHLDAITPALERLRFSRRPACAEGCVRDTGW
jgi:molybdopterin-synthase adenylyltransferase